MSSIGSMNATINNNRKLLNSVRRKSLYETTIRYSNGKTTTNRYALPKLPPHRLRRIRRKIRKEQRRLLIKQVIIAIIIFALITWCFFLL